MYQTFVSNKTNVNGSENGKSNNSRTLLHIQRYFRCSKRSVLLGPFKDMRDGRHTTQTYFNLFVSPLNFYCDDDLSSTIISSEPANGQIFAMSNLVKNLQL